MFMNALNSVLNSVFDVVLWPFELIGARTALIVLSGVFGILALVLFKQISWQKGIKATKDRIKGHLIEIRLFQNDLVVVCTAVLKILWRNLQYLTLNFGPILPLILPFAFLAAQFVTRYAYDPIPVQNADTWMSGRGVMVEVAMVDDQKATIEEISVRLPEGVRGMTPFVPIKKEGRGFIEVIADAEGTFEIEFLRNGEVVETKQIVAGTKPERSMQPRRVRSGDVFSVLSPESWPVLWPAEAGFESDSPFQSIAIAYPSRDLGWLPGGEGGILLVVIVASMAFGVVALKPLGVQI